VGKRIWMAALALAATPAMAQKAPAPDLPAARPIPSMPLETDWTGKPIPRRLATADFPEAARAAGEHGTVTIIGTVTVDGVLENAAVATSSRSATLDAAALAAARAMPFTPGRNVDGDAAPYPATLTYNFYGFDTRRHDSGLATYRCDTFARDVDWWHKAWPEGTGETEPLYQRTLDATLRPEFMRPDFNRNATVRLQDDFIASWNTAVAECRAKPTALLIEVFKPAAEMAAPRAPKARP
jgi:TonB family protein